MTNEIYFEEIPFADPAIIMRDLPHDKNFVFLDSAAPSSFSSRYSFIAYDPFMTVSANQNSCVIDGKIRSDNPLAILKSLLAEFNLQKPESITVPFIGGFAGYLGYEFVNCIEPNINLAKRNKQNFPDMMFALFDVVIAFDLMERKGWIFSSGFPEKSTYLRLLRAKERCKNVVGLLHSLPITKPVLSSDFILPEKITSNLTYDEYCKSIQKVLSYIEAGDIYQANIAQCFTGQLSNTLKPWQLYERLRQTNPTSFSAYLNLNTNILASASPERFISLQESVVTTSPIKGTIKRSANLEEDKNLAKFLYESEKNRAENLMIVDLMRNDLSRVCELQSVHVPKLFNIESFPHLHHLVSTVVGKLKADYTALDLLAASFPGGSITGAPKIRAIEIIHDIERHARGPYCGNIGYIGFDGTMDTSIIIRTYAIKDQELTFHVGGGIVADSEPHDEYLETLIKANALYTCLTGHNINQDFNFF